MSYLGQPSSPSHVPVWDGSKWVDAPAGGISHAVYSSRPSAGQLGRIFVSDDGGGAWYDDGTQWRPILPGFKFGWQPPAASGFTALNNTSGLSLVDDHGSLVLTGVNDGAGAVFRGFQIAADPNPSQFIEAVIAPFLDVGASGFPEAGIFMREVVSSQIISLSIQRQNTAAPQLVFYTWNSFAAPSSSGGFVIPLDSDAPIFLRLFRNTATAQYVAAYGRESQGGSVQWATVPPTTGNYGFITATAGSFTSRPDENGVWCSGFNNIPRVRILSLKVGH